MLWRILLVCVLGVAAGCATQGGTGRRKARPRYTRHRVVRGDTLHSLSQKYGVSVRRLMDLNRIRNPRTLKVGRRILIRRRRPEKRMTCSTAPTAPLTGADGLWGWPSRRKWKIEEVTEKKVYIRAPIGSPVWAAADGQVSFVGRREGYGRLVVIRHPNRDQWTRYGGNRTICVKKGMWVERGEVIAFAGRLSKQPGRHLLFEIVDGE